MQLHATWRVVQIKETKKSENNLGLFRVEDGARTHGPQNHNLML